MNPLLVSYKTLRALIGIIGIILPVILLSSGQRDSISNYYYSPMRDYFVGSLVAIAAFLAAYNGYDWRDAVAGRVAAIGALMVALIPHKHELYGVLHFVGAVAFLLSLAYISYYLFTKSNNTFTTPQKAERNVIYRACGIAIILGVLGTVAGVVFDFSIFWFEAQAVFAFGMSWLVKGEMIFRDQ